MFRIMPEIKTSGFHETLISGTLHAEPGGGKRIRTADPLLAKQVLFQLSYTPVPVPGEPQPEACVVGLGRVELPTSPLSGVRSSHLSYRPQPTFSRRAFKAPVSQN